MKQEPEAGRSCDKDNTNNLHFYPYPFDGKWRGNSLLWCERER